MKRIIVLDISQPYANIYDEMYYTEDDSNKYADILKTYADQPEKYVCVSITYWFSVIVVWKMENIIIETFTERL